MGVKRVLVLVLVVVQHPWAVRHHHVRRHLTTDLQKRTNVAPGSMQVPGS